jgi:hypothetical protein
MPSSDPSTTISLAVEGPVLTGRSHAAAIRQRVEAMAATAPVVVDFRGVTVLSPSFADELFAKVDPDLIESGAVRFEHMSVGVQSIARYVIDGRRSQTASE